MDKLFWIILILAGVAFLLKAFSGKIGPRKSILGYFKRERVMNSSEQALYINLQKTLGENFIVLSKVRIEDFVEVRSKSKNEWWSLRGRIKSRHVDFLICDITTTKPLLAIELDGTSHRNYGRIERDKFVNDVYNEINLEVVHVLKGSDFAQEAVKIKEILEKK